MTAKILGNSSVNDSGSMSHGKVMVLGGNLLDHTPTIAKVPATESDALLQQEVRALHVLLMLLIR